MPAVTLVQNPKTLQLPTDSARSELSPDTSRLAAVVSSDLVWDIHNGQLLHSLSVDNVSALSWHIDSRQLLLAIAAPTRDAHSIHLWDPTSSDGLTTVANSTNLTSSPDGQYIGFSGADGGQIVDLQTGAIHTSLRWMNWSPDGRQLATVATKGVSIWDSVAANLFAKLDERVWNGPKWSPDVCGFIDWLVEYLRKQNCCEVWLIHPGKPGKKKTGRRGAQNALTLPCRVSQTSKTESSHETGFPRTEHACAPTNTTQDRSWVGPVILSSRVGATLEHRTSCVSWFSTILPVP